METTTTEVIKNRNQNFINVFFFFYGKNYNCEKARKYLVKTAFFLFHPIL